MKQTILGGLANKPFSQRDDLLPPLLPIFRHQCILIQHVGYSIKNNKSQIHTMQTKIHIIRFNCRKRKNRVILFLEL